MHHSSQQTNIALIIPARFQSSRFPGKPLADIKGRAMINRVWDVCIEALSPDKVYVATDDDRIRSHCENSGIQVLITPSTCLTGTDRIFEAAKQIEADVYINVQGDEPLIKVEDIQRSVDYALANPQHITSAACKIQSEADFRNPNVPKVTTDQNNRLLYMSRAAIPTSKSLGYAGALKQVCIYNLPKEALLRFGNFEGKTPLEQIEDIEILRFLELGYPVQIIEVTSSSIAVDTPEDLERVRKYFND
jgi:3-deoxy-manno-octulosonate cytidylyltransferase (CMP-KDO synthetase)